MQPVVHSLWCAMKVGREYFSFRQERRLTRREMIVLPCFSLLTRYFDIFVLQHITFLGRSKSLVVEHLLTALSAVRRCSTTRLLDRPVTFQMNVDKHDKE